MSNNVVKSDSAVLSQGILTKAIDEEANGFPYGIEGDKSPSE